MQVNAIWSSTQVVVHDKVAVPVKEPPQAQDDNRSSVDEIGVFPKTGGKTPKWMVKIMENPIKMDDLGVPLFLETPIY